MSESTELVPTVVQSSAVRAEDFMPLMTVQQAVARKDQINQFISGVFREDEDFGKIPGGQQKMVLLKPGAEKLCSIFGLSACYVAEQIVEDWSGADHAGEPFFYYRYKCQLWRGDRMMGEAIGSCNSWESKYRYRSSNRKCPSCGGEFIIQGKAGFGGGWLCFKKKGGCGAKFDDNDKAIVDQIVGRIANTDVADQVNTLQKMAQKRALVAAVLVVTNCSDAFTQDIEDMPSLQQNTPEQQEQLAQRRIEETKAADVPKALSVLFENIPKPGGMKHALEVILAKMKEAFPESGERTYKRVLDAHGVKKGCTFAVVKQAILELWDLIQTQEIVNAQAAPPQSQQYQATDDDLPAGLFDREEVSK